MPKKKTTRRKKTAAKAKQSTATVASTSGVERFPIVGIGASAGGLDAFKRLFGAMPADSGMAFVLIPHLDPTHESLMVELLAKQTAMPVREAEDGMAIEPNRVYIIPPNKYLAITNRQLKLTVPTERRGLQTAIDFSLRSLATDQQENAIGIILSGTGSHGTAGLKEIKLAGGMLMVQQPETAEYDQMPRSAIATGLVDFVLPPEEMPEVLVKFATHPYLNGEHDAEDKDASELLTRVMTVLRTRTKYDFRCYRKNMLRRRVQRRMGLCHVDRMDDYLELLRDDEDEAKALYKDLLIGVTAFFREGEAFSVLEQRVIPDLVEHKGADLPVRVWVPGCATGEEAYSLAMLLIEAFTAAHKPPNFQIFATDLDEAALAIARTGIYAESTTADVSPERLRRFFVPTDAHHWQVNKQLREAVVFAPQNLIGDAPFSKLDLVSCRNLLIYLEPEVQTKVIRLFHFALGEEGYLLLGPSESIGRAVELFEPVSKKWRIYRRIGPVRRELVDIPIISAEDRRSTIPRVEPPPRPALGFSELMQKMLLADFAPASALIDRKYEVLCFQGPTVNYLEFPSGEPTKDLLAMARQGLRTKIRAAVHRALRENETVIDAGARVKRNGGYTQCTITVKPITEPKEAEGLLLVTFADRNAIPPRKPGEDDPSLADRADQENEESKLTQQLEYELKSAREDLQSTIEEMESSNEELKASHEEVMSMNEELQSANEELETSKEELQSLNEELSTVNNQLQDKVDEVDKANNDMTNLMASTEIATVFLDPNLRIVRFTPPTEKLLNLMATDIGRPLQDFAPRFTDDSLLDECRQVLDKLTPSETELHTEGRFFLRRILPYRTADNHIDGVVVTFVDITERVNSEAESRRLATAMRDSNDAVTAQSLDGSIIVWNRGAERMYGYSEAEALQMNIRDLVPDSLREQASATVRRCAAVEESESHDTQRVTKDGRTLDVWLTVSKLVDEAGQVVAVATTERDVTDRKQSEEKLRQLNETLEQRVAEQTAEVRLLAEAISHLGEGVMITSDGLDWPGPKIVFANEALCRITGYTAEELNGQTPRILQGDNSDRGTLDRIKAELAAGRSCLAELVNYRKDGTPYDVELFMSPIFDSTGHRTNFVSVHRDITERRSVEQSLWREHRFNESLINTAQNVVLVLDPDGCIVRFNPYLEELTGWRFDEVQGRDWFETFLPDYDRQRLRELFQESIGGQRTRGNVNPIVTKDGREREIEWYDAPLTDADGRLIGLLCIGLDVTERRMLEREILEIVAAEQRRIGQDLHDSTQQQLTGLGLLAQNAAAALGKLSTDETASALRDRLGALRQNLVQVHEGLKQASLEVNQLARGLVPVEVDSHGLMSALTELALGVSETQQVVCTFACDGAIEIADNSTATHLYRIAQEAVNNALKHSQADRIEVSLSGLGNRITLRVLDNGQGIEEKRRDGPGMGLRIMAYRAELIGAALQVGQTTGGGAEVACTISQG